MYFKKLELYGFKSFAEKTELVFEPGVTAVVGPNGCGKSNISDSIRWVLGEQNARELRGLRMEDVIFNGTEKKEPINFAEVSLTLSNESKILPIEFEEVVITRRVFRSGESEYLLNKMPVRHKDIADLLSDTGLGTTSYSMIAQGNIDLILSSKPDERRAIFEEAAGITKYKTKKKEAMRKLEQTEQNLLRVADIIAEVKRQINSIERQAQKAAKYKAEFEKLKTMDMKVSSIEYKELCEKRSALGQQAQELKTKEQQLSDEYSSASERLDQMRHKYQNTSRALAEAQSSELGIANTIERNSHKIGLNTERVQELESRRITLEDELSSLKEKLASLEVQVSGMRKDADQMAGKRQKMEEDLNASQQQCQQLEELIKNAAAGIEKAKIDIVDIISKETRLHNENSRALANIQNISSRARRLAAEKEKVDAELSGTASNYDGLAQATAQVQAKVNSLKESKSAFLSEYSEKQSELQDSQNALKQIKEELTDTRNKLEFLEELKRKHEGFSGGVKSLLYEIEEGRISQAGVVGVLANLIEVSQGYEQCAEALLGDDIQAVIVENTQTAKDLIAYVRERNLGRIKFIPLDFIDSIVYSQQEAPFPRASQYIKSNEKISKVINWLLCESFISDNIDSALEFIKNSKANVRIATKSLDIIGSGFISGGSLPASHTSLLGRDIKINEWAQKVVILDGELNKISRDVTALEEGTAQLRSKTDQCDSDLRQEEILLANRQMELKKVEEEKNRLADEVSVLKLEIDEVAAEQNDLNQKVQTLKLELEESEKEHSALQESIVSAQGLISDRSKQREGILVGLTIMQTELAAFNEKEQSLLSTLQMLENTFASDSSSFKQREKESQEAENKIRELGEETKLLEAQNSDLAKEKEQSHQRVQEILRTVEEFSAAIEIEEASVKQLLKVLEETRNNMRSFDVSDAELSYKQLSLKNRIMDAYKFDLDLEKVEIEPEFERDKISADIIAIKGKIESMGPVNLAAFEEHEELKQRYEFLTNQQQDLASAKEQLCEAIRKINKTTKDLFMDGFQKIQVTFREYFKMLFNGGDAELVLLDESDVLESGIEIIVRPPGKKLQNISLLSGGERAMTAISLLFAIFKVKPSPFCMLDEIDAPLDESNIDRFTRVLHDFLKTSQFIIITHNKKTISMADVMYGITMEQSGVSKIVSVKFAESSKKTA